MYLRDSSDSWLSDVCKMVQTSYDQQNNITFLFLKQGIYFPDPY